MVNIFGGFIDAASCDSIDSFQIQQVNTKNMALKVTFLYSMTWQFFSEKCCEEMVNVINCNFNLNKKL
jgi:hypothetical protein